MDMVKESREMQEERVQAWEKMDKKAIADVFKVLDGDGNGKVLLPARVLSLVMPLCTAI